MRKGSTVYLEGQLQTRKWTGKDGVEKYTTEVVLQRYRGELTMLGNKADAAVESYQPPALKKLNDGPIDGDLDDEIPF